MIFGCEDFLGNLIPDGFENLQFFRTRQAHGLEGRSLEITPCPGILVVEQVVSEPFEVHDVSQGLTDPAIGEDIPLDVVHVSLDV